MRQPIAMGVSMEQDGSAGLYARDTLDRRCLYDYDEDNSEMNEVTTAAASRAAEEEATLSDFSERCETRAPSETAAVIASNRRRTCARRRQSPSPAHSRRSNSRRSRGRRRWSRSPSRNRCASTGRRRRLQRKPTRRNGAGRRRGSPRRSRASTNRSRRIGDTSSTACRRRGAISSRARSRSRGGGGNGGRRGRRRSRDPDKPRRPASAFILFMQDFRKQHATAYRGVSVPDISRMGAQVWRNLPLKKKCEYQQLANERYDSYKERLDEYRAAHKRPDTAYQIFMREYYREHKATTSARASSPSDILTKGARKWRRMTLHEKRPYMQCAEERRLRHGATLVVEDQVAPEAHINGRIRHIDHTSDDEDDEEMLEDPLPPPPPPLAQPRLRPAIRTRSGSLLNYIADRFCGNKGIHP